MKVLMISTNTLPASPSGPAYVAGAVRAAGHDVEVYERLFAQDLDSELASLLNRFQPDVIGLSIRLVFGDELDDTAPFGTRHTDLRPRVKEIVDALRLHTNARIVLGGPGFNYYAADWLDYLGLEYGIRGEGEESFPLFLERLAEGGDIHSVPGCVFRREGGFGEVPCLPVRDLNTAALPAYDLFNLPAYAERKITPAIFTKRGCAFDCSYCPYSKLEGKRYRLKSPQRMLEEIRHVLRHNPGRRILFCDNSFNAPLRHAEGLCRAFIQEGLDFQWGSGDFKPVGVTPEFCRLLEDSG
ncbi:MAG TPA: cobalamin-dependent protein, partial [Anaerolinea sp.]|nr:cobalamin-dependent protein [Anaerolinea sp.]